MDIIGMDSGKYSKSSSEIPWVFTNNYVEVSCEMSHPGPVSPPFPILGVSPPKGATTGITILSAHTHTNKYIIHYYTTIIYVFKYMNV